MSVKGVGVDATVVVGRKLWSWRDALSYPPQPVHTILLSSRMVLLKGFDERFVWFTNYESKKGPDLTENSFAALPFTGKV